MLNSVNLMGRLTKDPELKYTPSNVPVTSFTLASERDVRNKETGEKYTDFIDCVAFRATAENIAKYFSKGRMAAVNGRLQSRSWTDDKGAYHSKTEIKVDSIYFADSPKTNQAAGQSDAQGDFSQSDVQAGFTAIPAPIDDDDLPF